MPLKYKSSSATNIDGLDELSKKLDQLSRIISNKAMRAAIMSASSPVLAAAKNSVPVGSVTHKTYKGREVSPGFLKRSLSRRSFVSRRGYGAAVLIGVKAEAFYGLQFLEQGTSKIPRRPWLVPAMTQNSGTVVETFRAKLRERLEKLGK